MSKVVVLSVEIYHMYRHLAAESVLLQVQLYPLASSQATWAYKIKTAEIASLIDQPQAAKKGV